KYFSEKNCPKKDITENIKTSFNKYRKKAYRFFDKDELTSINFEIFRAVPNIPSHNDLNAANLLYCDKSVKIIDPKDQDYNDIAKDIGRYCASAFFNNYDRFGNNKKHSLDIAYAFLSNFNDELIERTKYYIGESFMSFLNFQTITVGKKVLKKLATNTLSKKQTIMKSLEESL
ncbi:hypothetical protein KY312_04195, partial [Candidatus Woesearchaeota archaeon]|nr:hypothetical protein [Candidatus Woesearchaeota archaeon]